MKKRELGASPDGEDQAQVIRLVVLSTREGVEVEEAREVVGFGVEGEHSVPRVGVLFGNLVEHLAGVRERVGVGVKGCELRAEEGREVEAMEEDLGVELGEEAEGVAEREE